MIYDRFDAKKDGACGEWVQHKGRLPDSLFFRYFTMVDKEHPGKVYNKRENRLDPLFDEICWQIDKFVRKVKKWKQTQKYQ